MNRDTLLNAEENWVTDMGAWFPGENVVLRGRNVFQDIHDDSWMKFLLFVITGRDFDANQVTVFSRIWIWATSYPDPRLWNNRIAALAGSARSTGILGCSAGTAVSEAEVYGKQADRRAYDFIVRMKARADAGQDLEEVVLAELSEKRLLGGFGRPLVKRDERIAPCLELLKELNYDQLPHIKIALQLDEILSNSRYKLSMNMAAVVAAIGLDQGLSKDEFYNYLLLAFSAGHIACHIDAQNHPEGSFFPLRCTRIDYKGVKPRTWK